MTALLWCDKMYKNISKKLLHLTIEFFLRLTDKNLLAICRAIWYTVSVTVVRGWEYARFWENRFPPLCHRQINYLKEVLYYE